MNKIIRIGMDTSKHIFQLHGVDAEERPVLRRKLRRREMLAMKAPDPGSFPSGRQFAAWIGLTPKDHSTAGKVRLGVITRAGDEALRSVLVVGASAVIQQVRRGRGRPSPWLLALLRRKTPKLAAVALANKMARIAWKLMVTGEAYDARRALPLEAQAAWTRSARQTEPG